MSQIRSNLDCIEYRLAVTPHLQQRRSLVRSHVRPLLRQESSERLRTLGHPCTVTVSLDTPPRGREVTIPRHSAQQLSWNFTHFSNLGLDPSTFVLSSAIMLSVGVRCYERVQREHEVLIRAGFCTLSDNKSG